MKKLLIGTLLLTNYAMANGLDARTAFRGTGGGNGGNSVVCFDRSDIVKELINDGSKVSKVIPDKYIKNIISVETLDLYNTKKPMGLEMVVRETVTALPNESASEYADRIASKLKHPLVAQLRKSEGKKVDLYGLYELGKRILGERISVLMDSGVFPVEDIDPLGYVSENCVYSTMAVQRSIGLGERELEIDGRLFYHKNHSVESQGALLLHEYFLAAAISTAGSAKIKTTEGIQEFVGSLVLEKSLLEDVTNVINRRQLFKVEVGFIGGDLHLEKLENLVRQTYEGMNKLNADLTKEYNLLHKDQIHAIYKKLPKWFQKKYSAQEFVQLDFLQECHNFIKSFLFVRDLAYGASKCIKKKNLVSEFNAYRNVERKLKEEELRKLKKEGEEDRRQAYEEIVTDYMDSLGVDREAFQELDSALRPMIVGGNIKYLSGKGMFVGYKLDYLQNKTFFVQLRISAAGTILEEQI